ncbi:MAG TPA: LysR family transcriptional regulator [Candidatus Gallimonas intestinigallinarum]|uniref:LysR family transcriptional regulator n=1 Tax=Candidatus Gallimonas intestinigallinarum TaxID=2838604 RepID=A0A9D2DWB9_9FIRM|nr:LysR family transcriptional regulator [Candidatus Gallimonas intestinigallinarum]
MELIQMKYFLAVAREESISRAADFLYITQPSLTRQIQNMEKEVGQPLFVRGKKMRLTEAGQLLRRRAEEILALYEKTERELLHPQENVGGDVYLGGGETRAMHILLRAAQKMRTQYPDIRLHIHSGDIADVCEHVDKGLLDFGLVIEPADLTKYESLRLPFTERWGLILSKRHPLAEKKEIAPEDLRGVRLIQSRHSLPKSNVTEWYKSVAQDIEIVATYNLVYNAALMAEAEIGCVLCIDGLINTTGESKVCFRPLSPPVTAHVDVIWKKYQIFSRAAQIFLQFLREELSATTEP